MERRHKPAGKTRSGVNKDPAEKVERTSGPWELPHIAELIEEGQITIGDSSRREKCRYSQRRRKHLGDAGAPRR
jgi:hypothetical protein